jgi:hypothetical protein
VQALSDSRWRRARSPRSDQLATPLPYCRAIGVTPRTLEVWDDMGIASHMIDAGLRVGATRTILNGAPPHRCHW